MFRYTGLFRRQSSAARRTQQMRRDRADSASAEVEVLEDRVVLSPGILAVGGDEGSFPRVAVYDSATGILGVEFNPYPDFPNFTGGVRVAVGNIPDGFGNPFPIIVTAPGPGLNIADPVRIFSGFNGQFFTSFNPYPGFGGGIYLSTADFDVTNLLSPSRGFHEIVTAPGPGGVPLLRAFDLQSFQLRLDQFVYDPSFLGGVRVATGNINPEDEIPDIITAPGPGGGPNVRVFSGFNGVQFPGTVGDFFAYSGNFLGGVFVASGDFNGDGRAEIVTGADAGGGPHVRVIDPFAPNPSNPAFDLNLNSTQFPFEPSFRGGVRVASAYIDSDNLADLIVARGPGGLPDLRVFRNVTFQIIYQGLGLTNPVVTTGIFVASGKLPGEELRIAGGETAPATAVTEVTTADVQPAVNAAVARLEDAGVPESVLDELRTVEFQVADLAGGVVGLARPGVVVLDGNAAGYGWFIDPTPLSDEEFGVGGSAININAEGRVDLLTVILHEFGHQLGLEDLNPATDPQQLMTGVFNPGERRVPDSRVLDFLFAGDDLFDHLLAPSLL